MLDALTFRDSHTRPFQGLNHKEIILVHTYSEGFGCLRNRWAPAQIQQLARVQGLEACKPARCKVDS